MGPAAIIVASGLYAFYRERIHAAGASSSDIQTLADLSALPVLTKAEVQEHARELVSVGRGQVEASALRLPLHHKPVSAGTTGTSAVLLPAR